MAVALDEKTPQQVEAEEDAAFDEGAATLAEETGATPPPPAEPAKPEKKSAVTEPPAKKPDAAAAAPPPAPKYVQITEEQFASLNRAAEKTTQFEAQFSKVFGTLGDVQKIVKTIQSSTPRGTKTEIPKEAFAELEKEFPDLASRLKSTLEAALKNTVGTGPASAEPDPAKLQSLVTSNVIKLEVEALEDAFPDWKTIVGAIKEGEKPDPNHPFRKWLGSKDAAFQTKINGTNSATVIARAIRLFQKESATPAKPATPPLAKVVARTSRLKEAVQTRGDGGQPSSGKSEDDDFQAGFKSG